MQLLFALVGLIAVVAIVWISSLDWRRTVKFTFVLVILEGALRKWVLPQASELIYFLKDLVLLGAYLKYYLSSEPKYPFKWSLFNIFLVMAISWSIFQAFNPSLGSPIVGVFGLKAYFYYMPLMWMLPNVFQSEEELYKFLRNYLLLAIPVCLLAVAQFLSPPSSPINVYAAGKEATATFAGIEAVRVTGTFPYIVGYSTYMMACFSILIPMLTLRQARLWQLLTYAEIFLVVGTSFMTGARTLIFFEILFVVGYVCILWLTKPALAARSTQKFILPVILMSFIIPRLFTKGVDAFLARAQGSDSVGDRSLTSFREPWDYAQLVGINGYGIGATHQANPFLRQALKLPAGDPILIPVEGETGRVVVELGAFGFLFWYGLRIAIIFSILQVLLKLKSPFLRQLILAALLFQAINITAQLVFNTTFAIYYWFFSSFILLFPELEYRQFLSYRYWGEQQNV
ncbi:hypothetical protein [Fischerella sp. PCC 9605]|uniref:hypothetical protein n=1 Tax=Fischerella sp. PCC 9605 TaxID=1173024 RepID=UPI0004ACA815|nr:hypothetical protein [Fischerella sp. PCC 9605]